MAVDGRAGSSPAPGTDYQQVTKIFIGLIIIINYSYNIGTTIIPAVLFTRPARFNSSNDNFNSNGTHLVMQIQKYFWMLPKGPSIFCMT